MKNQVIPNFKREKKIKCEVVNDLNSKQCQDTNTIESGHECFTDRTAASKNHSIQISSPESEKNNDNLTLENKESSVTKLPFVRNGKPTSRFENYQNPRGKRNSHSSITTSATNHNPGYSVSTIDSPLKEMIKDPSSIQSSQIVLSNNNSFKRKRDQTVSEEKNLNIEISRLMKEKLSIELSNKQEVKEMKEKAIIKRQQVLQLEKRDFDDRILSLTAENKFLIESLGKDKVALEDKLIKKEKQFITYDQHQKEIEKMSQMFALKKKFLMEKIQFFQLLLLEKKDQYNTILSNNGAGEIMNQICFTSTSNIVLSEPCSNFYDKVRKSKISVDQSMDDFFRTCHERIVSINDVKTFDSNFKK